MLSEVKSLRTRLGFKRHCFLINVILHYLRVLNQHNLENKMSHGEGDRGRGQKNVTYYLNGHIADSDMLNLARLFGFRLKLL